MLRRQVRFELAVNGFHIATYVCDFAYMQDGVYVVIDVKGVKTDVYLVKKALMWACHQINVQEV